MTATGTCDDPVCAADPCYVHRRDDGARYETRHPPVEDMPPACPECGDATEIYCLAGGGSMDPIRRERYDCDCGVVVVVEVTPAQQRLASFTGDGDD